MATACWAFIVAKSPPLQAAYLLGSRPLQGANSNFHPQVINSTLCIPWGQFQTFPEHAKALTKPWRCGSHCICSQRQSRVTEECLQAPTNLDVAPMRRTAIGVPIATLPFAPTK